MKIVTVVGARPQLVKAAAVSHVLRGKHTELLVHTGQHYDKNMSDVFFEELGIPKPDVNLGVGSGSHGVQTARMLEALEALYLQEKPDAVLVYGDTNSTIAAALAASKLLIPVAHVEAGLRSFNMDMPEEQNRILTDHLSSWLFTPTETADKNLAREGIGAGITRTGDVMLDCVRLFAEKADTHAAQRLGIAGEYMLATLHRAENTDKPERLAAILDAFAVSGQTIILPLHPRTQKYIREYGIAFAPNIHVVQPVGYLQMLGLEQNAQKILTDSGGIQKEAYFLAKPCVTLRDETEWVETVENGWNRVVGANFEQILDAILHFSPTGSPPSVFGTGKAGLAITNALS